MEKRITVRIGPSLSQDYDVRGVFPFAPRPGVHALTRNQAKMVWLDALDNADPDNHRDEDGRDLMGASLRKSYARLRDQLREFLG